jgi:hypothetical protein
MSSFSTALCENVVGKAFGHKADVRFLRDTEHNFHAGDQLGLAIGAGDSDPAGTSSIFAFCWRKSRTFSFMTWS